MHSKQHQQDIISFYFLLLCDPIHQLVDLIQQEQTPLGILGPGNPGVDTAGDLVDVISNVVDFRPQFLDLLGGASLDLCALDQTAQVGRLGESTAAGTAL